MALWKCSVCGYIHDGDEAPDVCPNCGSHKEVFQKLEDDKAELIENSSITNDIHMELAAALEQIIGLAEEGQEINLDPGCYKIFTSAIETATVLRQRIKAEIQTHISKGKWG